MYQALATLYTTRNHSKVYIKVPDSAIQNLALCFLKAGMLDIRLAEGTQGWFVEENRLLTLTLPTGFGLHPPFSNNDQSWYLCYHKTDWDTIPLILLDKMVRPASWGKDADGNPTQYPSYGFFGYAAQLQSNSLHQEPIAITTNNLFKIGKGQLPCGILTILKGPTWQKFHAGGNDALQRACRWNGSCRGKEGFAAMHSAYASVQYITVTVSLTNSDLTWVKVTEPDQDLAAGRKKQAPPAT